jgi:hypothetical protein
MPERVSLLQVDQPLCTKSWGITTDAGGCRAHLSVTTQKCQNTRKTCAFPLDYAVDTALLIPGISGNYASTPDTATNSITGDLDIRVKVALNDWTPAAEVTLFSKYGGAGQHSWVLNVTTGGNLKFYWSADGTTDLSATSSVATGIADGVAKWVRVRFDVDNGTGGRDVSFDMCDDYDPLGGNFGAWAQLGSTQTSAGVTSIFNSTAAINIGGAVSGTSGLWAGKVYGGDILSGIAGLVVNRFSVGDAVLQFDTSVTSSTTGEVWTVNQSGSPKAAIVIGFRTLQLVTKQSGTQRYYNAAAEITSISTDPATLNLAGMDGRSEELLGQREEVSVGISDSSSADVGVDPYRFERPTGGREPEEPHAARDNRELRFDAGLGREQHHRRPDDPGQGSAQRLDAWGDLGPLREVGRCRAAQLQARAAHHRQAPPVMVHGRDRDHLQGLDVSDPRRGGRHGDVAPRGARREQRRSWEHGQLRVQPDV